jgi:hypothetical protein
MTLKKAVFSLVLVAPLFAGLALAQEMPKPGPEEEILKQGVGTWDASVESWFTPGAPATVWKTVQTTKMVGAFWAVDDIKGEFMNQPFEGHGTTGYDRVKKKYVGTWVDSMGPGLSIAESSYDAKAKTMAGTIEGPGPDGKPMKMRETMEWKDVDTKVFSMFVPGADGKEALMMRITYKRRK